MADNSLEKEYTDSFEKYFELIDMIEEKGSDVRFVEELKPFLTKERQERAERAIHFLELSQFLSRYKEMEDNE